MKAVCFADGSENKLMDHNRKTMVDVEAFLRKGDSCCIVNPCGSGKTSLMAAIVHNHPGKTFSVFTKQRNAESYYISRDPVFAGENIGICTYTKMLADFKQGNVEKYNTDFYICDEAHYLGADKWGDAFRALRRKYNPVVIGLTATAQRYEQQGTSEDISTMFFDGNTAGRYTSRMLQERGVFQEPEYILSVWDMPKIIGAKMDKLSVMPEDIQDKFMRKLENILEQWEKTSRPEIVLKELNRFMYKPACNRILVYVSRISEIRAKEEALIPMIRRVFPGKEIRSYSYSSMDAESNLHDFRQEDGCYIKVLFSVDKIMETVHIDDMNIAIMLRPSVSNRIITQQFGRLNSIGNSRKPLIIDMVDNLSNLDSRHFAGDGTKNHGSGDGTRQSFSLRYVSEVKALFEAIDKASRLYPRYCVGGFMGSLTQVCIAYDRDREEVRALMDEGMGIEEAIMAAEPKGFQISNKALCDPDWDSELSVINREETEKYIPVVQRFVKSRNITDEDIIQDLYCEMMKTVSSPKPTMSVRCQVMLSLNNKYTAIFRNKVRRGKYFAPAPEGLSLKDTLMDQSMCGWFREDIEEYMARRLTAREATVIKKRFFDFKTLEVVGFEIGASRERVRQIEAKALRKMRGSAKSRHWKEALWACEALR